MKGQGLASKRFSLSFRCSLTFTNSLTSSCSLHPETNKPALKRCIFKLWVELSSLVIDLIDEPAAGQQVAGGKPEVVCVNVSGVGGQRPDLFCLDETRGEQLGDEIPFKLPRKT